MKPSALMPCVLGTVLLAGGAWAQRTPSNPAQTHYTAASQLYTNGRFAEAAAEFERAWEISRRPELLFNIGRAWEEAGDDTRALDAFTRFEQAGAPGIERAELTQRLAAVRARLAARNAPRPAPSALPAPSATLPPPPSLTGPIAVLAGGGLFLAIAIPLWASATSDFHRLEERCPGRTCQAPSDLALRDDAATRALAGDLLAGVGAAAVVTGTTWLALTLHARASRRRALPNASAWCTAAGCVGAVTLSF